MSAVEIFGMAVWATCCVCAVLLAMWCIRRQMGGKEVRAPTSSGPSAEKSRKKKVTFANVIIGVCVAVALLVTLSVIWEYHRLNEAMPSGVLTAIFGMWGGELLIVALRQIFGSDVTKRQSTVTNEAKYTGTETEAGTETDISDIFGGSV